MPRRLLLLLPLLLLACDLGTVAAPVMLPATSTLPPPTQTASPIPPTATLTPSPTDTITLTGTFTFTPTETFTSSPTETPTITPNLFTYVFPVQPPKFAMFSKGGHPFPATDIFAPNGTNYVAVTSGTIDEVQEEKQFANEQYGKLLKAAKVKAKEAGIELKILMRPGPPAQTIISAAKEGKFDLVLVGHTGLSGVWAAFLGTTAEKVSRHAPCSVLIVR